MEQKKHPILIPLTQWAKHHPWPSASALRQLVYYADKRGFNDCFKRVGRRVLIDQEAFFAWVDQQDAIGRGKDVIEAKKPWEDK